MKDRIESDHKFLNEEEMGPVRQLGTINLYERFARFIEKDCANNPKKQERLAEQYRSYTQVDLSERQGRKAELEAALGLI